MRLFQMDPVRARPTARRALPAVAVAVAAVFSGCGAPGPAGDGAAPDDDFPHSALTQPAEGTWSALIFVAADCPVSNRYAPEIRRICAAYEPAGVQCTLVYAARHLADDDIREHLAQFKLDLAAVLDSDRSLVARAAAKVTPQAAVFTPDGTLAYSGRIDNLYAELGRPRQSATEHDLRNALDDLVAGRPVRTSRTQAIGCYIE